MEYNGESDHITLPPLEKTTDPFPFFLWCISQFVITASVQVSKPQSDVMDGKYGKQQIGDQLSADRPKAEEAEQEKQHTPGPLGQYSIEQDCDRQVEPQISHRKIGRDGKHRYPSSCSR